MSDHDHIDDLIDEWLGDDGDEPAAPTWRATIRGRRLTLTEWAPWLARGGPQTKLLSEREQAGYTIADLTIHGAADDEISVRFYAVDDLERAEELLTAWATRVGYRRLWLPDRLVSLEPQPEALGTASVRCPTCRATWSDSSPEFWLMVKRSSLFPKWCPICGCQLPQWDVDGRPRRRRARRRAGGEGWSPSETRSGSRPR